MILHPDEFFDRLYASLPPSSFQSGKARELVHAQETVRETLAPLLGIEKIPFQIRQLEPRILEEPTDAGGYLRSRISFKICEGLDCPVYILSPLGAPRFGAVLALHGHGFGSREIVGLHPDGTPAKDGEEPGGGQRFALELVRRGLIVAAPDLIGFGDLRLRAQAHAAPQESSCYTMSTRLLLHGLNMAGLRVYQCMRVLDYMQRRSDIDPQRVGCMGFSGGGTTAIYLSALDARIKAAVVSGGFGTFEGSIMAVPHCIDNFPPALLSAGELPDLAALTAPRPLLIEAGTRDPYFPIACVHTALSRLRHVYTAFGVSDRVQADLFEGGHRVSGRLAYDFLEKWLVS